MDFKVKRIRYTLEWGNDHHLYIIINFYFSFIYARISSVLKELTYIFIYTYCDLAQVIKCSVYNVKESLYF